MSHQNDWSNLDNSPSGNNYSRATTVGGRGAMPLSVIVAASAVGVIVVVNALAALAAFLNHSPSLILSLVQLGLACLILAGIVRGHRLAWQWGRVLAIIGAVLLTLGCTAFVLGDTQAPVAYKVALIAVILLIVTGPLYAVFFALGRPSAKVYYRLICPKCGAATNKAADFFFNKARCKSCGEVWR